MIRALKSLFFRKSGLAQLQSDLQRTEEHLRQRIDFLGTFINLALPERLELDARVVATAKKRLAEELGSGDFIAVIHKNDLMWAFHLQRHMHEPVEAVYSYFKVGMKTAQNLHNLAREAGINTGKILDFGSGYGRVARFLPQYFDSVYVSEVKEQALRFQEREFNLQPILHGQDTAGFPQGSYDLILALSVFTHLPQGPFEAWLSTLMQCLEPGGGLVFTYLDQQRPDMQKILRQHRPETAEFIYLRQSEDRHFNFVSDHLSEEDYGSSFVTRTYLEERARQNGWKLHFLEDALVPSQNAALLQK